MVNHNKPIFCAPFCGTLLTLGHTAGQACDTQQRGAKSSTVPHLLADVSLQAQNRHAPRFVCVEVLLKDAFGRVIGVGAVVGMKPSEQVYSQVIEREQFRNTTKYNEGSNGEVHHATATS